MLGVDDLISTLTRFLFYDKPTAATGTEGSLKRSFLCALSRTDQVQVLPTTHSILRTQMLALLHRVVLTALRHTSIPSILLYWLPVHWIRTAVSSRRCWHCCCFFLLRRRRDHRLPPKLVRVPRRRRLRRATLEASCGKGVLPQLPVRVLHFRVRTVSSTYL